MNDALAPLATAGQSVADIPVPINFDIIRLFSEGLYRSPHKAIEELVTNGYDAGANRVHILLPEELEDDSNILAPLWVIDDGHGMDTDGFHQLWRVAESNKTDLQSTSRAPIGQFGIGKLAAYVLAWRLTHISRNADRLLLTTMDFRRVTGRQNGADPALTVSLRQIDENTARRYLAEIELRDPAAWRLLFADFNDTNSWTVAGLTDFKDLYQTLSSGRLQWVLSAGLPLHSDFNIFVNGRKLVSTKENLETITQFSFTESIPGIGDIKGSACIHKKPLTTGKSLQYGRSNGFFVRVRGRVINLEDELFGITQPNHASWSRFALEVDADGLRNFLLSSREGVRDSDIIRHFREFLLKQFNRCRNAYEEWERKQQRDFDINALLSATPSSHVLDPLFRSVSNTVRAKSESFYVAAPEISDERTDTEWTDEYQSQATNKPFEDTRFVKEGVNAPALRYNPNDRVLIVNADHPFVDKITNGDKQRNPAKLFASSEVLLEGQLQEYGIGQAVIANLLKDRDRVLRLMAGEAPPTATEVVRRLAVATQDELALERAVGAVFQLLGFDYERRGGNSLQELMVSYTLGLAGRRIRSLTISWYMTPSRPISRRFRLRRCPRVPWKTFDKRSTLISVSFLPVPIKGKPTRKAP